MARRMDWTVMPSYGRGLTALAGTVAAFPLYKVPSALDDDVTEVEDENDTLFLNAVRGDIAFWADQGAPADVPCGWRMMMLQADLDAEVLQLPFDGSTMSMNDAEYANLPWWDERSFNLEILGTSPVGRDPLYHPWWTQVDNKPKRSFGKDWNLWPGLLVWNGYPEDIRFTARLRCLVSYS